MTPDVETTPPWERVEPTFLWAKHGLEVIGDRHLSDGRRQHIVKGCVHVGTTLDNADVFGEDEPSWRAQQFSAGA